MARRNFVSGTVYTSTWGNDVENVILTSAIGDGSTDDTAAIQADLDECETAGGGTVRLYPGKTYKITEKLTIASNCFLVADGTSTLQGSYVDFTNTAADGTAGRYGTAGSFVDLSGLTIAPYTPNENNGVIGVKFVFIPPSDILTGGTKRSVSGIIARNVINVTINKNDLTDFMTGVGIRVATLEGGNINENYVHDFFDNNDWTGAATSAQITGIEVDNDRVNAVGSFDTKILHNHIVNMICGAQSISTAAGYQSDGINLAGLGGDSPHNMDVSHNVIRMCAEGIDCFGSNNNFTGNIITESYNFGLKFIHGAQYNSVNGGVIEDFGLGGIVFAGSATAGADTRNNIVTGMTISNGDYLNVWNLNSSYGIGCIENTSTSGVCRYNYVQDCVINMGAGLKYALLDQSEATIGAGNAGHNIFRNIRIFTGAETVLKVLLSPVSSFATMADPTVVRVYKAADQTIVDNATDQKVLFDTEVIDRRGEWASNRFTCTVTGIYDIEWQARFNTLSATDEVILRIKVNNTVHSQTYFKVATGGAGSYIIKCSSPAVKLAETDYVEFWIEPVALVANVDMSGLEYASWGAIQART